MKEFDTEDARLDYLLLPQHGRDELFLDACKEIESLRTERDSLKARVELAERVCEAASALEEASPTCICPEGGPSCRYCYGPDQIHVNVNLAAWRKARDSAKETP